MTPTLEQEQKKWKIEEGEEAEKSTLNPLSRRTRAETFDTQAR